MIHRICILFMLLCTPLYAELELNPLFSEGAILQRQQPVPVWGWADKGALVEVSCNGHKVTSKTGQDGAWKVVFPAMEASTQGQVLEVTSGEEKLLVQDILIGEVWLCSGQSNMDFILGRLTGDAKEAIHQPLVEYIKKEIVTAEDPYLRQISVKRTASPLRQQSSFTIEGDASWISVSPENNKSFSATAYFFAKELREQLKVPVGLVKSAYGGTPLESWIPMIGYQTSTKLQEDYSKTLAEAKKQHEEYSPEVARKKYDDQVKIWETKKEKAAIENVAFKERRPGLLRDPLQSHKLPSTLFNGMIAPLAPYSIKGVIWYQGESNSNELLAKGYGERFAILINEWRKVWGQERLDFYWCQLANIGLPPSQPLDSNPWASVCYQQFLTLRLPNTGMAVLNDIGEAKDIHPHNKMDAGKRLSYWALNRSYGRQDIIPSGPLYQSHVFAGAKVIITFDQVGSGLMVGRKFLMEATVETDVRLRSFQIKGADGKWKWADAEIISKDQVVVSHPDISDPVEVRYAWSRNPNANLYNQEGFPASLFKAAK